jgi:Spy/CpxP family protein refolding chaperone
MVWTLTSRTEQPSRRPFLRGLVAGGLLGGLLGAGASASAEPGTFGFWHSGRGCARRHPPGDPEAARQRADFLSDRVLDEIDASAEQRERIKALVAGALADLLQLREQHQAHRAAFVAALAQPAVDRAELERIRKAEVDLADRASHTVVTSLASMSEALSPEQRARLAALAARWQARHRGA